MSRSVFLRILFCGALLSGRQDQAAEEIDQFIGKIPYEQKIALEHVSQNMLTSVFACLGYVLYGNKPMCIVAAYEFSKIPNAGMSWNSDITELKWFDFLTGLNIQPQDKKYPFVECKYGCLRHLIFINRDLFIETVNRNLPLFRYILGRTLTAESFLDALLKSGDHFYDTLKGNDALLGILLGYGTQNSLLVSREEDFAGASGDERICFPFESYETFSKFQQVPSIGFSTIQQEQEKLHSLVQGSTNIKDFDYCHIPHFGCDPSLKETRDLLSMYEKNREQIIQIVKDGDCLAKLLKRICTTISGIVTPPQDLDEQIHEISYENSSTLKKYVDCAALNIFRQCKDPHFKEKLLIEAVLKGMKCAEEGGFCPTPDWTGSWSRGYDAWSVFERHMGEKKAYRSLRQLAKQNDIVELIPKYVYHKILIKGEGTPATKNIKNVTFHFSLHADNGALMDSGTFKKVELEKLIPGVAYSFIGMQRGEERDIYIHPKYAYRSSLWPSMIVTRTQLKLLDFEEGEAEAMLPKIRADLIDDEHFQDFLNGYKKAKGATCFSLGYHFWKQVKELDIDLDLEEFSNRFRSESIRPLFLSEEEERQFILDFNCYLFSRDHARATVS
jgi:hypothetical protein